MTQHKWLRATSWTVLGIVAGAAVSGGFVSFLLLGVVALVAGLVIIVYFGWLRAHIEVLLGGLAGASVPMFFVASRKWGSPRNPWPWLVVGALFVVLAGTLAMRRTTSRGLSRLLHKG